MSGSRNFRGMAYFTRPERPRGVHSIEPVTRLVQAGPTRRRRGTPTILNHRRRLTTFFPFLPSQSNNFVNSFYVPNLLAHTPGVSNLTCFGVY